MKIGYEKIDCGGGWYVGCGIEFSFWRCLDIREWMYCQFFHNKPVKKSLVTSELVITRYKTHKDANFITGAQWVVIKVFKWYFRLHQLR